MAKPISVLHQIVTTKFDSLKIISADLKPSWAEDLNHLHQKYTSQSMSFLGEYFFLADKRQTVVDSYIKWILGQNFIGQLDAWCLSVPKDERYATPIRSFNQAIWDIVPHRIDYRICPKCKGKMTIYPHTSEMRCDLGCVVVTLKGTVFDDTQFYSSGAEGQSSVPKRGRHETNKHCKTHLEHILAIKAVNVPPLLDAKIDQWIKDNGITYLKGMSCETFRRCFKDLKDVKASKFNIHVPYIRQQKTGVSPEGLKHHEIRQIHIYFDKVIQAIGEIMGPKAGNMKYYPFFIAKILEIILSKPEDQKRLQSIIDCIHFQRDGTIVQNDKIWEQVCTKVPEFHGKFKKTDRNMLQAL